MKTAWEKRISLEFGVFLSFLKVSSTHLTDPGILESSGKLPSEEGMKSDGEQRKSGEWVEKTVAASLDERMPQVSVLHFQIVKRQRWLIIRCQSGLKIREEERCLAVKGDMSMCWRESHLIEDQSPVVVLSRWETLTCTEWPQSRC